jgi:hypothetical protein
LPWTGWSLCPRFWANGRSREWPGCGGYATGGGIGGAMKKDKFFDWLFAALLGAAFGIIFGLYF